MTATGKEHAKTGFRFSRTGAAGLLALLMAISSVVSAQEASGGITGKVSDPSGAAVVNADVSARDVERGTIWSCD